MSSTSNLFKPIQVGELSLQHRVVLAPLTRLRTAEGRAPLPLVVKEYYSQRSSIPGSFLILEGTITDPRAAGYPAAPEIFTDEQKRGWKEGSVVNGVHSHGSFIFMQLVNIGRAADSGFLKSIDASYDVVGPSAIPYNGVIPKEMSVDEIKENIKMFVRAARSAVDIGFDGVEIHGANGFLIDQFIQDVTNQRTDTYGGSVENRSRFALEVIDAVSAAIGPAKTSLRLSPFSPVQGMGMKVPHPQFAHLVTELRRRQPHLAYLHVIEPRVWGHDDLEAYQYSGQSNDFIRNIWYPLPLVSAGGYTRASGIEITNRYDNELVAYGRVYISNPDLPRRLNENLPLNKYDRSTFYLAGDATGRGYTDYPFTL